MRGGAGGLEGTEVELVESPAADEAPAEEAERIRRTLSRLFPSRGGRQTLRVLMGWSNHRGTWTLHAADQQIADVAWSDRTNDVAEALAATGLPVAVRRRGDERRRSVRLFTRLPLYLASEKTALEASTTNISRHGATILSPVPLERESTLRIATTERRNFQPFRVVWCGRASGGHYKAGVEMLDPRADLWGRAYEPEAAKT